ncbi:MAG: serine acetyltransferase [Deltaproteobacteria bacterium]|jgi:serine O-acetyltransferase|nr:serine acetyltransferase [Deltaproteobacteria bacterium]
MTDALTEKDQTCEYKTQEEGYVAEVVPVLKAVCDELMDVRRKLPGFEYVTTMPRPGFRDVAKLVNISRYLLFPGFFEKRQPASEINVKYSIGQHLTSLYRLLSLEIYHAIRHHHLRHRRECTHCKKISRSIALGIIKKLPHLRKVLASDVEATKEGDPAAGDHLDQIIFCYPGVFATMVYRLAHELHVNDTPFLPRMMTEYAHGKTGIDIHPGAKIGQSFFIDHGTGVVVGETTVIGERVRLYQGVTLGALSLPKDAGVSLRGAKRHPTLEDDVIVYSGATILGGETVIGARCVIGGNVWLTESIPPDTKVFIKKPELIIVNNKPGAPQ